MKLFVPDIKTDPAYLGIVHSINFSNKPNILDNSILEFLKFLNQEITMKNYFDMLIMNREFNFENVWNRRKAVFHSTFSDSKRNCLGLRKDFW